MATTSRRDFMTPEATQTPEPSQGIAATVKEKAHDVAETAGDLAGQAKEKVQQWTSSASEGVGQATDKVKDWAATACEQSGDVMKSAGSEVTRIIRRYPMQSLLVGFAVGFLLARTLRT